MKNLCKEFLIGSYILRTYSRVSGKSETKGTIFCRFVRSGLEQ